MPLDASVISNLVFTDYLAAFPDVIDATRSNPATGVPLHLPAEAFVQGLVGGVVAACGSVQILDKGDGDDNGPGTASPVSFALPGAILAPATFKSLAGWDGESSDDAIAVFIGSVLQHVQAFGLLQMSDNADMGDGTSIVSPPSNPNLEDLFFDELQKQMPISFQATGKFGEDDIPSNPVSKIVVDQLDDYCRAYAIALASITATVQYTAPGAGSSVNNVINTGAII
jgi:hypothetical protein